MGLLSMAQAISRIRYIDPSKKVRKVKTKGQISSKLIDIIHERLLLAFYTDTGKYKAPYTKLKFMIANAKDAAAEAATNKYMNTRRAKESGEITTGRGDQILNELRAIANKPHETIRSNPFRQIPTKMSFKFDFGINDLNAIQVTSNKGKSYPLWVILEFGQFKKYKFRETNMEVSKIIAGRLVQRKLDKLDDMRTAVRNRKRKTSYLPMRKSIKTDNGSGEEEKVVLWRMQTISSLRKLFRNSPGTIEKRISKYGTRPGHFMYTARLTMSHRMENSVREIMGEYYGKTLPYYKDMITRLVTSMENDKEIQKVLSEENRKLRAMLTPKGKDSSKARD